jgi:hypothetical protein
VIETLALDPRGVKEALSLRTIADAERLWDDANFPGIRDGNRLTVDKDDLKAWWKRRKDQLRKEQGHAQETKTEEEPECAGDQAPGAAAGRNDWSKIVLRPEPGGSRAIVARVPRTAAGTTGKGRNVRPHVPHPPTSA